MYEPNEMNSLLNLRDLILEYYSDPETELTDTSQHHCEMTSCTMSKLIDVQL